MNLDYHLELSKYCLVALLGVVLLSCQQQLENQKPNIIFILADDQRDNTFGAMGHPFIKTPHIDKLINNGVRFSNTYIAEPVCSPSRVSLFTGMHERMHGVGFSSSYQLTEAQWKNTYPAILRENGYYTGFIGKFGLEFYTFRGGAGKKFDYWHGHDGWTKFFPKDHEGESTAPYHEAEEDIITPIMGEEIEGFLSSVVTDKPFCLSVSLNVPHGSQTTSMYMDYEDWHKMSRPANENPKLKGHPIYDTLYRKTSFAIPVETAGDAYQFIPKNILDQDEGRNRTYDYDYNRETTWEHHVRYYQTITGIDQLMGEMMKTLEEKGLAENTIIIYASDHGLLMGEYGMGGKSLLYDLTSKIPCFIYDPRLPEPLRGREVDKLVSSLDIPVTILDYASLKSPNDMRGMSLLPLIKRDEENWRQEIFLESLFTRRDNPFCEGIRMDNWKYIRMYDGVSPYLETDIDFKGRKPVFEQLFNLEKDPEEKINLVAQYEGTELLDELRSKVAAQSISMNQERDDYKKRIDFKKR